MFTYTAPRDEMDFLLDYVFNAEQFWQNTPALAHVERDTVAMILDEMAKFSTQVLLPLNAVGDRGVVFDSDNNGVSTPPGFQSAFQAYTEAGWLSLGGAQAYGGQDMPKMVTMLTDEMLFSVNQAFALYPNLTTGASICLLATADDATKNTYLPKLYSGEWTATMCLTENTAGTDLGRIQTKAIPQSDGSYLLTGSKIFITSGEHDLADNIIHLVLAKTPNAPAGSRGISLFIVPKFLNDGTRNGVFAGGVEHKMGINGSATCVMHFEQAKGQLLGKENGGLSAMFVMMNYERMTMGLQGLGAMELGYQSAHAYAHTRLQGQDDHGEPVVIAKHGDVARMLMTARVHKNLARCFSMYVANALDIAKYSTDTTLQADAERKTALLTPISKAFLTDCGFEMTVLCQQVFGGHGYIKETQIEQLVRDTRIAQIYEGTNGIQAKDFLSRKVLKDNAQALNNYLSEIEAFVTTNEPERFSELLRAICEYRAFTDKLISAVKNHGHDNTNAICVDYLAVAGLISYGYMSALMVNGSAKADKTVQDKYAQESRFFMAKIFPTIWGKLAILEQSLALDDYLY